jgi:Sulfotransferase family
MSAVPGARPKVIYVMGAGRTGSTILGVALGNCEGVFYAGELDAWLRREAVPNFGGEEREEFWRGIQADVNGAAADLGEEPWELIEHSSSILRPRAWRARRRLRRRYRRVVEDLYLAIARARGSESIVDTSHYPLRARELQALPGIELHVVYLTRSPEDVVRSFGRSDVDQPSKPELATNLYLHVTNLLSLLVFLRQPRERRFRVRYEDFQADPLGILAALLRQAGVASAAPDLQSLRTGIPFQGNRLLNEPVVGFRAGGGSKRERRTLTRLMQAPWRLILPRLRPVATPEAWPAAEEPGVTTRIGSAP